MDRLLKLLGNCAFQTKPGLEFGPLANPLVRKDQGPVKYVDYTGTGSLREKSRTDRSVDPDAIVEIDFNLEHGSLREICGPSGSFAYAVASHVFEHLSNPLGWLRDVAALLEPHGVISLAIPDRRYTFDHFRRETTMEQLVAYDYERLERPSMVQMTDHFFNVRLVDTAAAWQRPPLLEDCPRYHPDEQIVSILDQAADGNYVDCHCTVWTSETFPDTILPAIRFLRLPLRLTRLHAPEPLSNEFIVQFARNE